MKQCAIVIPIYKEEISYYESISLKQCFAILHNHPILFICPVKLKDTKLHEENKEKSEFIFVDNNNFDSIIAYNKMLMSVWFYELFVKFDSVLIYQLDCFVFKDELNSWIEKGFSYLGAPWFLGNSNNNNINELIGVGNGGFSLRNINDSIKVLKSTKKVWTLNYFIQIEKNKNSNLKLLRSLKKYLFSDSFKTIHKNKLINEDKLFSHAGTRFSFFNIPKPKQAIPFAFEMQPKKLYNLNNKQLPFGCHAWWKYDLEFYVPFIKSSGYILDKNEINYQK